MIKNGVAFIQTIYLSGKPGYKMNPIDKILHKSPLMVLDGALGSELEKRGHHLDAPLWSAKILLEQPDTIQTIHHDYYKAGAHCVITASYQATVEGFMAHGLNEAEASKVLQNSVVIAQEARDHFLKEKDKQQSPIRPLVAASVGPYGAYLANGSEYNGKYDLNEEQLIAFHAKRLQLLVEAQPDILACETIPCLIEAKALVKLLHHFSNISCWISFSAKSGTQINSGESIEECVSRLDNYQQVAAIGINCTAPEHISTAIQKIRQNTDKPIIVYPNSGDTFNLTQQTWVAHNRKVTFGEMAKQWFAEGANIIGGCCQTSPEDIREIASWARKLPTRKKQP